MIIKILKGAKAADLPVERAEGSSVRGNPRRLTRLVVEEKFLSFRGLSAGSERDRTEQILCA
jgi:hypothetical protein